MAFSSNEKTLVIGLDGVPYSLLQRLIGEGDLPNLSAIAASGSFLKMRTVLPPVSSVAWSSFMTGTDPGGHGIFGFTDLKPGQRALSLPSFDDLKAPPIWLQHPEKRTIIVNLPFTYPAGPLNGILIAGFVVPIFERSVFPESLIPWLKSKNYRADVDAVKGRSDKAFLFEDLFETLNIHERVILTLMAEEKWDVFMAVVTGTDRINHFLFDAVEDASHLWFKEFRQYYRRVDSFVGNLLKRAPVNTRVVLLSDHGFTELKTQVYLNHLLKSEGYLRFKRPDPTSLEDIDPRSSAFAMEPGRIYLNSKQRFQTGVLDVTEALEVRSRLKSMLERIRPIDLGIFDDPQSDLPIFKKVIFREDAFQGPHTVAGPDLVIVPRNGYDLKANLNPPALTMKDIFTGMHTDDDAFLMTNFNPDSVLQQCAGEKLETKDKPEILIKDVVKLIYRD